MEQYKMYTTNTILINFSIDKKNNMHLKIGYPDSSVAKALAFHCCIPGLIQYQHVEWYGCQVKQGSCSRDSGIYPSCMTEGRYYGTQVHTSYQKEIWNNV